MLRVGEQVDSGSVTHVSNRAQSASTSPFLGLPTGAAIGINVAVLVAASLLAVVVSSSIPWYFLALFAASVVLTTTFVNIRGVYLTVASAPLLFVGAVLTISFLPVSYTHLTLPTILLV